MLRLLYYLHDRIFLPKNETLLSRQITGDVLLSHGLGSKPVLLQRTRNPRGSTYTTIVELGPKRPSLLWFRGPNSIMVVYVDPLGVQSCTQIKAEPVTLSPMCTRFCKHDPSKHTRIPKVMTNKTLHYYIVISKIAVRRWVQNSWRIC